VKKSLLWLLMLMAALSNAAIAQTDNFLSAGSVSPYVTMGRNLTWGGIGLGTVGQNFIFHPLDPNEGFCLFIQNNNTTGAHTLTLTVAQTGDPALIQYAGFTQLWFGVPTATSFPLSVPANSVVGVNYKTTASAGIVISVTGNATVAGSPDTANLFTVQTNQSACGTIAGNVVQGPFLQGTIAPGSAQFPVLTGGVDASNVVHSTSVIGSGLSALFGTVVTQTGVATNLFQKISNNFSTIFCSTNLAGCNQNSLSYRLSGTSFMVPGSITDELRAHSEFNNSFTGFSFTTTPAAGFDLLDAFCSACGSQPTMVRARISCGATTPTQCDYLIQSVSTVGTTCTVVTPTNMLLGSVAAATATVQTGCTGGLTIANTLMHEFLAANTTVVIDLNGWMFSTSTGIGIKISNVTAITVGSMGVTLEWAEE
jgi:hypothetical protein